MFLNIFYVETIRPLLEQSRKIKRNTRIQQKRRVAVGLKIFNYNARCMSCLAKIIVGREKVQKYANEYRKAGNKLKLYLIYRNHYNTLVSLHKEWNLPFEVV